MQLIAAALLNIACTNKSAMSAAISITSIDTSPFFAVSSARSLQLLK